MPTLFITGANRGIGLELCKHLLGSLDKIKKRLGGVRYEQAREQMQTAIEIRKTTGSTAGFVPVVNDLLVKYYDPVIIARPS